MHWFKSTFNIDDLFLIKTKKQNLKARAAKACGDHTDYQLRLKKVLIDNRHNINMMTKIAGHMSYLKSMQVDIQLAAKETLELFTH